MINIKSVFYFVAAGLCEIGGGYLVWLWLREGRSIWFAIAGAMILVVYGVIPTLQPANFGRVYFCLRWNIHRPFNLMGMEDR